MIDCPQDVTSWSYAPSSQTNDHWSHVRAFYKVVDPCGHTLSVIKMKSRPNAEVQNRTRLHPYFSHLSETMDSSEAVQHHAWLDHQTSSAIVLGVWSKDCGSVPRSTWNNFENQWLSNLGTYQWTEHSSFEVGKISVIFQPC